MKLFIVFFALLLVFVSFSVYTADIQNYVRLQERLKLVSEDCAAGAALAADREYFGRGYMVIDDQTARDVSSLILEKAEDLSLFRNGSLSSELQIFDDVKGYRGCEKYGLMPGLPCAVYTIKYTGKDLFRLPFLSKKTAQRTSTYQWDASLTSAL